MAKFSKIITESKENLLINKLIEKFRGQLSKKLKLSKRFSFVLAGGESPIKLYKKLNKTKGLKWAKVDFFIGDERYVNQNSNKSNIKLCKKYLLNKLKISSKQIFKIPTDGNSLKKDALMYENKIKKYFLKKKLSFDLILLGLGTDGHIASLFKKNINKKNKKIVDFIKRKDSSRITLTITCINKSKFIFLWAPSKKKKIIIKKVLLDKNLKYPVSYLRKKNTYLFNSY
jgi:6-phosphogluconolactonase